MIHLEMDYDDDHISTFLTEILNDPFTNGLWCYFGIGIAGINGIFGTVVMDKLEKEGADRIAGITGIRGGATDSTSGSIIGDAIGVGRGGARIVGITGTRGTADSVTETGVDTGDAKIVGTRDGIMDSTSDSITGGEIGAIGVSVEMTGVSNERNVN